MKFSVSVIIPVYNCESFIEKAIESVLLQPEVFEIIVVNDGSTDDSLSLIEALQKEDDRIKIYHHKNAENKGRSATRNLGIQKATGNFIAFLDADDFYLENRFNADKVHFENNPFSDGVYNAIGVHFYRESNPLEEEKLRLTTVTEFIEPCELFDALLYYKKGHFSIDGLTVKRSIFEKIGYFNEALKVAEDTELFFRMALKCQLKTGVIDKAVAMRGVHDFNVFNNEDLYNVSKLNVYESLIFWSIRNQIHLDKIDHVLNVLWMFEYKQNTSLFKNIWYWFYLFFKNSSLLFTKLSIKYFPVVRLRQKLFPFLYKQ
jgi:glycosyltransferase involved in cell wall biosynthesis